MEEGKEVKKRGTRRKNGEGSKPYYDKKRKRWRIQYTDNEGKPQVVYDKTEQGVIAKFQEIKVALNKNRYIKKSRDTVKDIMEDMLKDQKEDMKPGSYKRKTDTSRIINSLELATKPIQKVGKDQIKKDFKELRNRKNKKGDYKYSQSYLDKIFELLQEIFEEAVDREKISPEQNPFKSKKGVKRPTSGKLTKKVKPFNKQECIDFLQELNKRL